MSTISTSVRNQAHVSEVLVLRCAVNGGHEERTEKKNALIFN